MPATLTCDKVAIARVFPRKTTYTPEGEHVYFDGPGLFPPPENIVEAMVSVTFSWDKPRGERLASQWGKYMRTEIGGPAYDDPGGEFNPGVFLRSGFVMTSRGCPRKCDFCVVPKREGNIRPLTVQDGNRVLDSNLFACPRSHIESVFKMLHRQSGKVGLHGGLDAKLAKPWHYDLIGGLGNKLERIYLANDTPAAAEGAKDCIRNLRKVGLSGGQIRCFVLCGHADDDTPAKAEDRCLDILKAGAVPFASYYRDPSDLIGKRPPEWARFVARWAWMPGVFGRIKREDPDLYTSLKATSC